MLLRWITVGVLVGLAAGCGAGDSADDAASDADEHVWSDQTDALDKARGVQETLDQAHETRTEEDPER